MPANIKISRHDRVVLITLDRPKQLNALSEGLAQDVVDALTALDADPSVGCFVITGNERAFAAGAEIRGRSGTTVNAVSPFATWSAFAAFKTPKIAAVQGYALGGGCELAMMCDYILAGASAKFGQPEIKLGVIAGMGGTQRLTRLIGRTKSMRMHLTGRMMNAEEAEACGLVAAVFPDDELIDAVLKEAATIAGFDKSTVELAREAVNKVEEMNQSDGLAWEEGAFLSTLGTQAHTEGVAAFREKRAPKFNVPDET